MGAGTMTDIPPPPPGFTLMADNVPPPPAGFTLIGEEQPGALSRIGRYADNTVRQLAQGATLGFMDEISAGLRTGAGLWGNYGEALAAERARDTEFRNQNPVAATVANIAGGVASPVARVAGFNPGRAASLPGAIGRGAGAGAVTGGVTGFGEGEGGFQARGGNALVGAGVGAALGGALPVAIEGARAAGGAVARRTGLTSGSPDAERIMLRDLQRDGVTPQDLLGRVQESNAAGRPEIIADLAGENVRGTAAAIARAPGQGRQVAGQVIAERSGPAQATRMATEVQRALGGDDFRATTNDIVARRSAAARPLYDRAWRIQLRPDEFERVAPFVNDRIGQDAMQRGLRVMELEHLAEGRTFNPADFGVQRTADGWVPLDGVTPNMRLMDAVKRGYDQIVESFRDSTSGVLRLDEYGLAVNQVRAAYRNQLAEMFPPYRRALESWSGPSGTLDAMGMGRRLLSESAEAGDVTANQIARLPAEQREAFRLGVARGLMDRIEGAGDGAELTRLRQVYGTPRVRERLRAAFDNDDEFRAFTTALDAEARMAATNRAVAPNAGSQTAPLQERMADLRTPPSSGVTIDPQRQAAMGAVTPAMIRSGLTGGITGPLFQIAERLQQGAQQSRLERNMDTLAPMLFGRDPAAREQVARALMARALTDERTMNVTNPRLRALARGLAVGGSIEANE